MKIMITVIFEMLFQVKFDYLKKKFAIMLLTIMSLHRLQLTIV